LDVLASSSRASLPRAEAAWYSALARRSSSGVAPCWILPARRALPAGHQSIGDRQDALVVGHDHHRPPLALRHLAQGRQDAAPGRSVERGGRLVAEHDRRLVDQRARDGDPLHLSPRE
jgi:hypothetical protein